MSDLIRCGFGLGNRVAAMANGLSRWPEIRFVWRDNAHCPARHQDIFPRGIPGVEFITDAVPGFASHWDGRRCHAWDAAADRAAATAAYARIMAALAVDVDNPPAAPGVSIIVRFHRHPTADPAALAREAARHAARKPVFILADSRREELTTALSSLGVEAMLPHCPALTTDMGRQREDMPTFARDWHTACRAAHVVTPPPATSLAYPSHDNWPSGAEVLP